MLASIKTNVFIEIRNKKTTKKQ